MTRVELTQYTNDEESAETYLRAGNPHTFKECPYCQRKMINRVRRFKYKSSSCNCEWGERPGSIIEGLRVPCITFLMAIKLFEVDTSVRKAAKQLRLAYTRLYNIHSLIWKAILTTEMNVPSSSGEIEMDGSYFSGRREEKHGCGAEGMVPKCSTN